MADDYATGGTIEPTILHIKPDDVLFISNVGEFHDGDFITRLRAKLPTLKAIFVFAEDIDVHVLRREGCPFCATPDSGCPVHRDGDG